MTVNKAQLIADNGVTPGSFTNANITVDAAGRVTAASSGSAGVSTSLKIVSDVSSIPSSPIEGDVVEITNSTNIQTTAGVTSVPVGFIGSADLAVWLKRVGSNWVWVNYSANDPDARYQAYSGSAGTYQSLVAVNSVSNTNTPIGTIVWLQQEPSTPPEGWLYCGGANKSRNQYPNLFSTIGTTYGSGDGVTTFGLPLEASLTPPEYAVDSSWHPFIKYGAKIGEDGVIWVASGFSAQPQRTYNVSSSLSWTKRSNADVEPVYQDVSFGAASITPDGQYLAFAKFHAVERLWAGVRNGNGWNKMTIDNLPTTAVSDNVSVAISPDGNYMVHSSVDGPMYQWTRSGLTWTNRVTIAASGDAAKVTVWLRWSPDSTYLAGSRLWQDNAPVVYKVVAGVLTPLGALPAAPNIVGPPSWHPSGLYLITSLTGASPALWARAGDSFALTPITPSGFTGRCIAPVAWSSDGSKLFIASSTGYGALAGVRAWTFNGSSFTLLPTTDTTADTYGVAVIPGSNTDFIDYYTGKRYSVADGTVRLVGSVSADFHSIGCRWGMFATTA